MDGINTTVTITTFYDLFSSTFLSILPKMIFDTILTVVGIRLLIKIVRGA